jgi:hypothetical protein
MGFEPTTFCMASRRSSQLSYSRAEPDSSFDVRLPASGAVPVGRPGNGVGNDLPAHLCPFEGAIVGREVRQVAEFLREGSEAGLRGPGLFLWSARRLELCDLFLREANRGGAEVLLQVLDR